MKLKKCISILLTAGLLTGVTACGGETGGTSEPVNGAEIGMETAQTSQTDQAMTDGNEESVNEFTYWLPLHPVTARAVTDLNEHPGALRLEEKTGIHVDYVSPPVGQELEQMNLLLASGTNMPDLFRFDIGNNYRGGVEGALADGVI